MNERPNHPRLEREKETIRAMLEIYCHAIHHTPPGLCPACEPLLAYALQRIEYCPYGTEKPTCAKCHIHCYIPGLRAEIHQVMRYAGPRMILRHPVLTILHFLDERKQMQQMDEISRMSRSG